MFFNLYRYIREWIAAFELAAQEVHEEPTDLKSCAQADGSPTDAAYPLGLSRCGVCGAVLVRITLACTVEKVYDTTYVSLPYGVDVLPTAY